jgi:hypothetical protein
VSITKSKFSEDKSNLNLGANHLVTSKYSGGKNESVNSELLHSWRPISVSNRYAVLTDSPESMIGEDENGLVEKGESNPTLYQQL